MSIFKSTGGALTSHTHLASLLTTSSDDGVYSIRNVIQGNVSFHSFLLFIDWSAENWLVGMNL